MKTVIISGEVSFLRDHKFNLLNYETIRFYFDKASKFFLILFYVGQQAIFEIGKYIRKLFKNLFVFFNNIPSNIIYLIAILICFVIMICIRLHVHTFGISIGYLYLFVIALGSIGFGSWGGIATAVISCLIFFVEVNVFIDWHLRDVVFGGMIWRFLGYIFFGTVLGYYTDIQKKQKLQLKIQSDTDYTTGLYNYRYFISELGKAAKYAQRYHEYFSLVIIDIDNFKTINDTHGHLVGDDILKHFGRVIKENIREVDILARYGGDEFLILLYRQSRDEIHDMLNRVLGKITTMETKFNNGVPLCFPLSFSAGVSFFPDNTQDPYNLLLLADDALYWAKRSGRNKVFETWGPLLEKNPNFVGCERRRSLRFSLEKDMSESFIIETPEKTESCFFGVLNISLNGALIEGENDLSPGEIIYLIVSNSVVTKETLKIEALVLNSKKNDKGLYEINVTFRK